MIQPEDPDDQFHVITAMHHGPNGVHLYAAELIPQWYVRPHIVATIGKLLMYHIEKHAELNGLPYNPSIIQWRVATPIPGTEV